MENIKLVVCDIDNTLVPKRVDISEHTFTVIKELQANNIMFGLASGRGIFQLKQLEARWGIKCDVLIGMNGSELYDGITNKEEHFYEMEPEWIKECLDLMASFKTQPIIFVNGVTYLKEIDKTATESNNYAKSTFHIVENEAEFYQQRTPKICFRVDSSIMNEVEAKVSQYPNKNYYGIKTENTMYEFCNINASKGKVLQMFCEAHNISPDQVVAFGDMSNDITLFDYATHSVCMCNGSEDAKVAATYITDKDVNNEGVADFIKKHILI